MRNFENEEIIHSWKKDIKSTVILVALSLIGILCIGFTIVLNLQTDTQVQEYKEMYEDYQYYTIMDNLVGSSAAELDNSGSTYKFKKFYDLISSGEYFEYYMMYNQSVYMADYKGSERNIYGYEYSTNLQDKTLDIQGNDGRVREYTNLKGFWIGDNVTDDFKFKFMDGAGFSSEDFYLKSNGNISIILGANYADSYKVGDEVYIDFVFAARKATVVGILEEGTNIYYRDSYRNLDTSVIMPIFENDTYNGEVLYNLNVNHYYTFRNSGLIRTKLSCADVQEIIEGYSKEAGFDGAYYVTEYDDTEKETFSLSIASVKMIIDIIAVVVILLTMTALIVYYINKIEKNNRYYAVLLMNGSNRKSIFRIILREITAVMTLCFIVAVIAVVASISLDGVNVGELLLLMLLGTCVFSIIPATVVAIVFFKRDLIRYMKEEV